MHRTAVGVGPLDGPRRRQDLLGQRLLGRRHEHHVTSDRPLLGEQPVGHLGSRLSLGRNCTPGASPGSQSPASNAPGRSTRGVGLVAVAAPTGEGAVAPVVRHAHLHPAPGLGAKPLRERGLQRGPVVGRRIEVGQLPQVEGQTEITRGTPTAATRSTAAPARSLHSRRLRLTRAARVDSSTGTVWTAAVRARRASQRRSSSSSAAAAGTSRPATG